MLGWLSTVARVVAALAAAIDAFVAVWNEQQPLTRG